MRNRLQPLDGSQIQIIHNAGMRILNTIGISFEDPEAIDIFKEHGFKIDGDKVFFEETQVLKALETIPSEFTIQARNPENNIRIGGDHFAFGPGWAAPFVIDTDGNRRTGTLKDQENSASWFKLRLPLTWLRAPWLFLLNILQKKLQPACWQPVLR